MRPRAVSHGIRIGAFVLGAYLAVAACDTETGSSGALPPTVAATSGDRTAAPSSPRPDPVLAPLDQRPIPDNATGKRIRATVAEPCPAADSGVVGVANPDAPDLDRMLVPPGSPTSGRLCRYQGAEPLQGHDAVSYALTRNQLLNSAAAARLADAAAQVSLAHPDPAGYQCPADFGTATVIVLSYPGRPDVDLWQIDSGCTYLTNGHIRANVGLPEETLWASPRPRP